MRTPPFFKSLLSTVSLFALVLVAGVGGGCGMASMDAGNYGGSEFGATQGGVQDMTLARSLVDEGQVPPAEAFTVEAMFSEHDLPVTGAACETTLCLRATLGIAPDADGADTAWLQVGMSSTINPQEFVRPSQTLIAVVDVSGSMGWDYPNEVTPGTLSGQLLGEIADQLHADDQFVMITFGSTSRVVLDKTSGANQTVIQQAIADLHEGGVTDMESGIQMALPIAFNAVGETDAVRIMIFSDYNPNVGATEPSQFQTQISQASAEGVGVTLFGLGLGLDPSVMKAMSEVRGANAFSAVDEADVGKLMEDSWPWMVCPLAYDLKVSVTPAAPFGIAASYGFPGEAGDAEAALEVATVFLSRRKGGMLIALQPSGPSDATELLSVSAQLQLDYVTLTGEPMTQRIDAAYDGEPVGEGGQSMPQIGIARATALALLVSGMKEAAEAYAQTPDLAEEIMAAALARYRADAELHADAELDSEIAFAEALLQLIQDRAPQGNFYGSY